MRNKYNIAPIDISSSREFYGLNNSADVYKGTSFKFSGPWSANTHYFNDEYIIDFVSDGGSLWACQRSHLSTEAQRPGDRSVFWTRVISGVPGQVYVPVVKDNVLTFELSDDASKAEIAIEKIKGDAGKTYIPETSLSNGNIVFKEKSDASDIIKVDISSLRGEKGDAWVFSQVLVTTLEADQPGRAEITKDSGKNSHTLKLYIPRGIKGDQGERGVQGIKGDKGDVTVPQFQLQRNEETASVELLWSTDGDDWKNLGSVGGRSPKLMRVFDTLDNPDEQNGTTVDDRIVWGYDGEDEWTTLCYLDELRGEKGDENIAIGCPGDFEGGEPDHDKIWFDPCDDTGSNLSAEDII